MTAPATIAESIDQAAREGLAEVTVGKTHAVAMTIAERIAADQYAKANAAGATSAASGFGLRFATFKPGGPG